MIDGDFIKNMRKKLCLLSIFIFAAAIGVKAQECPADRVCISPEAARKAITDAETVKAQVIEITALKQALLDEKEVANKLKIEFAEKAGENTALKQQAVRADAIIDLLLKSVKKKCLPFSVCF